MFVLCIGKKLNFTPCHSHIPYSLLPTINIKSLQNGADFFTLWVKTHGSRGMLYLTVHPFLAVEITFFSSFQQLVENLISSLGGSGAEATVETSSSVSPCVHCYSYNSFKYWLLSVIRRHCANGSRKRTKEKEKASSAKFRKILSHFCMGLFISLKTMPLT